MKKFVVHIVYFSIALWIILAIVDAVVTYKFHQIETRKYGVWNAIMHQDLNADLLVMGNSRAWGMYSTYILDSVLKVNSYNIGIDGSAFNRQKVRYDVYRHYQQKPKIILQNVEYFTLNRTTGYEHEQFMPYLMHPYFRKCICREESFSFGELYIPMYRYYVNNVYDEYTKFDYSVYKGYGGEDKDWDGTELAKLQPYYQVVDTATYGSFVDYIEQAKKEDIQLVFVFAPVYIKAKEAIINSDSIKNIYTSLSEQYDIPFLDFSDCYISYDTTYFYNAMHLNRQGAELFSTHLAQDIDSLGLLKPHKESN